MRVADFDYDLPPALIAQEPTPDRPASRMLVVERASGHCALRQFIDFPSYLKAGDCLVVNNTRVLPCRLFGTRATGGRIEALLLEPLVACHWQCMLRPGRRLREGEQIALVGDPSQGFEIVARRRDGTFEIRFATADVETLLEQHGEIPLPPYIRRAATAEDRQRYQTVYATQPGAVAAPTAGLHFTSSVLADIAARGVSPATVTLHVGPGTFKPVQAEHIEDHQMHEERFELSPAAAETINATRRRGGRIIAVGTTSVRVLESCVDEAGDCVVPGRGRTRLFMHPPMRPRVCDGLLTNFHLPRSTLLMLVSTFSTVDNIMAAYRLAVQEGVRFYSYGDCMFLPPE